MPDGHDISACEPRLVTFGCRMNAYESEVMRGHARAAGLNEAIIVNTCAVTAEAERQARQAIRKLRRENPTARIIVTGCAAQLDPEGYRALPGVDRVLGNAEKLKAESYLGAGDAVADIMTASGTDSHILEGFEGRARAFVQVQQGCDHRCTFCIVPFARGPSRSVPLGAVVEQAKALAGRGYKEIILTGVDILSWGADLPGRPSMAQALRRLLKLVPEVERLRLTSLDPAVLDAALIDVIATEERIMPHIHLSVQAGDDMILKRMKRRHSRAEVLTLCERLKLARPGLAIGADLIAGFPTEDAEMFANTLALVEEADLTHLHVFPYSPRPGTPAAKMPPVAASEVKARAAALREAGESTLKRFQQSKLGHTARILVEKPGFGHSEHYLGVEIAGGEEGQVVPVTLTGFTDGRLRGETA